MTDFLLAAQGFHKSYERTVGQVAARHGMTGMEIHVLLFLVNNPGRDTAREVAELRFLAKSCVSKAVEALTLRGFLRAEADPADRRVAHLHIQPAAAEVTADAREAQRAFFSRLYTGVPPQERAAVERALAKIIENLKEAL